MNINIPDYVNSALLALENAGHQGFIVGGCVRDALMGKKLSNPFQQLQNYKVDIW